MESPIEGSSSKKDKKQRSSNSKSVSASSSSDPKSKSKSSKSSSSSSSSRSHHHRHSKKERSSRRRQGSSSNSESQSRSRSRSKSSEDSDDSRRRRKGSPSHDKKSSKKNRSDDQPSKNGSDSAVSSSGGGDSSLSIEETNKLRAKLGLKPLAPNDNNKQPKTSEGSTSDKKTYIDKDTNQEFEHAPAKNIAEIKEQKDFKLKLQEQRERRRLMDKVSTFKGIADEEEEKKENDDSAAAWLEKIKQKEEAKKKAKLLEEMDQQFGEDTSNKPKKDYTSNNLKGLRVEHSLEAFKEGQEIILTLKDKSILKGTGDELDVDDEEEEVLVNVNILDDERAAKNVENKKNKPDYKPYDEFDEDGNFKEKSILEKYNEELEGEKKKSFKLGTRGTYDASDEKFIERLNEEHKSRAIKLNVLNELKVSNDYLTQEEMEKFKKPKKVRRVLRKNKILKADDLIQLPSLTVSESTSTNKSTSNKLNNNNDDDKQGDSDLVKKEPASSESSVSKKISLKDIDFGFKKDSESSDEGEIDSSDDEDKKSDSDSDDSIDLDKLKRTKEEEAAIIDEENNALDELHTMLSKTRKKITQSMKFNKNQLTIKQEKLDTENVISFDNLNTINEAENDVKPSISGTLTMDTMSEFCRNLAQTSYAKRLEDEDDDDDEEVQKEEINKKRDNENMELDESDDDNSKDARIKGSDEDGSDMDTDDEGEHKKKQKNTSLDDINDMPILEDEPTIDRGLASALKLAVTKGYLVKEKEKQNARLLKNNIEAVNYTVEEKNYYDIDDKYNRNRDRFSGPLSDFQEKSNYKPDIKLDYIDEKGHNMNEKEAFRYLSHRFHGKGSGKKKTEKRVKKLKEMETMNKMSSIDTPLNTVALLVEKQKKLQQPYVLLSTNKGKNDQVTLHKR